MEGKHEGSGLRFQVEGLSTKCYPCPWGYPMFCTSPDNERCVSEAEGKEKQARKAVGRVDLGFLSPSVRLSMLVGWREEIEIEKKQGPRT